MAALVDLALVRRLALWSALTCALLAVGGAADAEAPTEYQVKAVYVFNFSHFVAWPQTTFEAATQPFVIGVLGSDPFGPHLEQAVHGEAVDSHPLVIRHYRDVAEVGDCQILFIDRSQRPQLQHILSTLDHRSILTVSDLDDASRQGVMIQLATEKQQIRLRINAASAHAAGLTISSNLLRLAELVGAQGGA